MTRAKTLTITLSLMAATVSFAGAGAKKSLYERMGGIHRIATAVDLCVEMESKDPILNRNERFRMALSVGKPYIKFTLTNNLAAGAGGPQKVVYNVAPFSKWLNLSKEESDRAWSLRQMGWEKAGIATADFLELKAWFLKQEAMAKPMAPERETFKSTESLYARLGGIMPIAAVVNDFAAMLATDPTIASNPHVVKALSMGKISGAGLRYLLTEQIAQAAGGPYTYSGRGMKEAHMTLMITEKEWSAGVDILKKVLAKFNVPEKEQAELFVAIASTHDDIVGGGR